MSEYVLTAAQKKHALNRCIAAYGTARSLGEAIGKHESVLSKQASRDYPNDVPPDATLAAATIASMDDTYPRLLLIACGKQDEAEGLAYDRRIARMALDGRFRADGDIGRALALIEGKGEPE